MTKMPSKRKIRWMNVGMWMQHAADQLRKTDQPVPEALGITKDQAIAWYEGRAQVLLYAVPTPGQTSKGLLPSKAEVAKLHCGLQFGHALAVLRKKDELAGAGVSVTKEIAVHYYENGFLHLMEVAALGLGLGVKPKKKGRKKNAAPGATAADDQA